ncbi:MAG: hypothetical protein DRO73_01420 [Candidatus Thorarchaeota archaeon]|nr:MAG: hypothetical protein DRO73_01420 [Candidatus Thorarchaeota archaeon]
MSKQMENRTDRQDFRRGVVFLDCDDETGDTNAWIVFEEQQSTDRMHVGLICLERWGKLQRRFYPCIVALDEFAQEATRATLETPNPFLLTRYHNGLMMWVPDDIDAALNSDGAVMWLPFSHFSFGRPAEGRLSPIRWIRLSAPSPMPSPLTDAGVDTFSADFIDQCIAAVHAQEALSRDVTRVRPYLSGEDDEFVIAFVCVDTGSVVGEYRTKDTQDAVAVLRDPIQRGVPYPLGGAAATWDPLTDVNYGEIITVHGSVPLDFLRPLVKRSTSPVSYAIPSTAGEIALWRTDLPATVTVICEEIVSPVSRARIHSWRVRVEGPVGVRLRSLEKKTLTVSEILGLIEQSVLPDEELHALHPLRVRFEIPPGTPIPRAFIESEHVRRLLQDADVPLPDEWDEWWDETREGEQPDEEPDWEEPDDWDEGEFEEPDWDAADEDY